ncbi:MAG: hypothetical protein Kow0090_00380 [Myxococcota bacterium]
MRKAVLTILILALCYAAAASGQESAGKAPASKTASSAKAGGYQDLIPLPTLYLSERQPYLERYFSIEPSLFVGGYAFAPKQIYQNTWWLGARLGVLLFWGVGAEFSFAGSRVKLDNNALRESGIVPENALSVDDYVPQADLGRQFFAWNLNVMFHPIEWPLWHSGWGTMIPFARGGFGTIIQFPPVVYNEQDKAIQGGGVDNDPTFGVGVGLKYLFPWWDFVGLRVDMYYSLIAGFGDNMFDNESQAGTINSEFTGGVFGNIDWWGILYPSKKKPAGPADADGDGVIDEKDKCPDEIGPPSNDGCPITKKKTVEISDRDGDGVPDNEDLCPNEGGSAALKGCPDKDGDGIADKDDKCPDKKGDKKWDGCPDSDSDGIPDHLDKCPDVAEDKNNYEDDDGCPEGGKEEKEKQEVIKKFSGVLEGINFLTGKATLTEDSKKFLNTVADKLKAHPTLKVTIEGHTDSVGSDKANQRLSQQRAESVRTYLIGRGVKAGNVKAIGYGEAKPIADNKTAEGRAKNRRIEFKIEEQK